MTSEKTAYRSETTKPLYRGTQVVYYILGVLEALLALRFFLRLAGANSGAAFTQLIYDLTYPFTAPFATVFRQSAIGSGHIFEWTTLLAMFVYWLIAVGLIRLFIMSRTVSTPEAASKLSQHED